MEYTSNYHLPQWVESDRIMMEDFNQMCSDMEAGLTSNAQAAAAAQAAAERLPYVIGSYIGNGESQTIDLGFKPKFVIITGQITGAGMSTSVPYLYTLFSGGSQASNVLKFNNTGFSIVYESQIYPDPNSNGKTYSYIAFS